MKIVSRNIFSPKTYLLLAVLQLLHYFCSADAGTINIDPVTQHANISQSATFYCRATGTNTRWSIKNAFEESSAIYKTHNFTDDGFTFSEIEQPGTTNADRIHDMYLEIPATPENNRTEVSCVVWVDTPTTSATAMIIVQGGPAAPEPVLRMINTTNLVLEWNPPFTWPYTMISHYKISVNNSVENWNCATYATTSLQLTSLLQGECEEYTFSVLGNNGLSDGKWGRVTGGFPIVPQSVADSITHSVTYRQDGSPIITLSIELPVVCSYQRIEYRVVLKESSGGVVSTFGPTRGLYKNMQTIKLTAEDNQLKNKEFLLVNLTFILLDVDEGFSRAYVTSQEKKINMTVLGVTDADVRILGTEQVILICGVGGTVVLTLAMLIVVCGFVCMYRRKKRGVYRSRSSGSPSPKRSPMVTNPIYEGQPIYETVDPRFRTISNPLPPPLPNTSCPPIAVESPYNNSNIDPDYAYLQTRSPSFPPPLHEEYTIMTSAGALGKMVHSSGESNLDRDISEVDRYVPQPSTLVSEC